MHKLTRSHFLQFKSACTLKRMHGLLWAVGFPKDARDIISIPVILHTILEAKTGVTH